MTSTAKNLCLHYVDDAVPKRILATSSAQLLDAVDRELTAGRTAASLADYLGATPPDARAFTLSFDDAHRSVLTHVAPLLGKHGVPCTLFVPVLWIGTSDEWLTWDELRQLRDAGVTLGSHSMSHPRFSWRLYDESADVHAARLYEECARSKEILERELGLPCDLFAYPYGEDPDVGRDAVRRAGYSAAFTVRESPEWSGDRFSIPRVEGLEALEHVQARSATPLPISVVVPARDRSAILRETLGRLEAQSYPEELVDVVVVDDGSTEDVASLVASFPKRFSYHRSGSTDGVFRAGTARNVGARAAKHNVLAFLDADIAVPQDYLWALDWIHQRHDDAVVFGYLSGYNLHDLGHTHSLSSVRDVERLESVPVIPDRSREPGARACLDNIDWLTDPWKFCYTGNLSVTRSLFDRVGAFSSAFEGWGLEDIDIGVRLAHATRNVFFSRFALGYHLVDADEGAPRNPFRRAAPKRDDFAGYLQNLTTLERLHANDEAVAAFAKRSRLDIDETCNSPSTVGVEFGGNATRRAPFHRRLHRCAPGGIPTHELLDRVAYAKKVSAKGLWLLGGEPAEHPGFFPLLKAAKHAGMRHVGMQSHVHAFAEADVARAARELGLGHVTVIWSGVDRVHEERFGKGAWRQFEAGLARLRDANIHLSARVVLADHRDLDAWPETKRALSDLGIQIDEVTADDSVDIERASDATGMNVLRVAP